MDPRLFIMEELKENEYLPSMKFDVYSFDLHV